jgi:hypothetical protein
VVSTNALFPTTQKDDTVQHRGLNITKKNMKSNHEPTGKKSIDESELV